MHSPLPDASALEAGIIEDSRPSRLSRVQDNVRNLLRASVFGSPQPSPVIHEDHTTSPVHFPAFQHAAPEVLSSPSTQSTESSIESAKSSPTSSVASVDLLLPVATRQPATHMTHQSALFNTRAVAALDHPDLSDPSLAITIQKEAKRRQRHAWKRSKHGRGRGSTVNTTASHWLICVVLGLALAGILATYIALATAPGGLSPTFHALCILGIVLTSLAFMHTLLRVIYQTKPTTHRRNHGKSHKRHHNYQTNRTDSPNHIPTTNPFVPTAPIPVLSDAEIRLDPHEAQPSSAVHQPPEVWDKGLVQGLSNPPPAYGRWRGSVRADPELLHWKIVASPDADVPGIPSPTYEEVSTERSLPDYVLRESPFKGATRVEVEPEMVHGNGIGDRF